MITLGHVVILQVRLESLGSASEPLSGETSTNNVASDGADFEFGEGARDVKTIGPAKGSIHDGIATCAAGEPQRFHGSIQPCSTGALRLEACREHDEVCGQPTGGRVEGEPNRPVFSKMGFGHLTVLMGEAAGAGGIAEPTPHVGRHRATVACASDG